MKEIEKNIKEVLEKLRPFLQSDGGDVQYIGFEDGIVKIRMMGACVGCHLFDVTVYEGIEMILIDEVPGVIGVKIID